MDDAATPADRLSLNLPYPTIFLRLLTEHYFSTFTIATVKVYSNLRNRDDNLGELLGDEPLTRALTQAGFLPFGRPSTGSYDRVCFDVRRSGKMADVPIVVMEHEAILSFGRLPKPVILRSSLMDLFDLSEH